VKELLERSKSKIEERVVTTGKEGTCVQDDGGVRTDKEGEKLSRWGKASQPSRTARRKNGIW